MDAAQSFAGGAELRDLLARFAEPPEDPQPAPSAPAPSPALGRCAQTLAQWAELQATEDLHRSVTRQLRCLDHLLPYRDLLCPEEIEAHLTLLTRTHQYLLSLQQAWPRLAALLDRTGPPDEGIPMSHRDKRAAVELFRAMMAVLDRTADEAGGAQWLAGRPLDGQRIADHVDRQLERRRVYQGYRECLRSLRTTLTALHRVAVGPA